MAYNHQYRREALARGDLNWSVLDSHLYNEAFTGRAKAIPRCQHCLSEAHVSAACLFDPNPCSMHVHAKVTTPAQALPPMTHDLGEQSVENTQELHEGRCKFQHCKYTFVCKDCLYPHPWILCHSNPAAPSIGSTHTHQGSDNARGHCNERTGGRAWLCNSVYIYACALVSILLQL